MKLGQLLAPTREQPTKTGCDAKHFPISKKRTIQIRSKCCLSLPQKEGIKEGRGDGGEVDDDGVGVVLHWFSSFLHIGREHAFHGSKIFIACFNGDG